MYFLNKSDCAFLCASTETIEKIKSFLNNNAAIVSHKIGYIIVDLDVLEDTAELGCELSPLKKITDIISKDSKCSPDAVSELLNSSFSLLKLTPYDQ